MANRIDIPNLGPVFVPEWATEDQMRQLLTYLKINSDTFASSSNRNTRQTTTAINQQTKSVKERLTSVYDATVKNYASNNKLVSNLGDALGNIKQFGQIGGPFGVAVAGLIEVVGFLKDGFRDLEKPLMDLSGVGIGLNATFRDITSGAMSAGQTIDQFSSGLLGAGTGLQVLQDQTKDVNEGAKQAVLTYGNLIKEIKNQTRDLGFYGLSLEELNQITNDQLELARLEGLKGVNVEEKIRQRVLEVATVTTNLARQTNRDRQSLIDAVQSVVQDDDLLAYLKTQGDPELISKLQDNINILSAGLGPETGQALAGVLTKSISQGIPIEGVDPMMAELAAITGGQSTSILNELSDAIQSDDTERVANLTNAFSDMLRGVNLENQRIISILSNQGSAAGQFLQKVIAEAQKVSGEGIKVIPELPEGDTDAALDRTVLSIRDLRGDINSLTEVLKIGVLSGITGLGSGMLGGASNADNLGRQSIEEIRDIIVEMLETGENSEQLNSEQLDKIIKLATKSPEEMEAYKQEILDNARKTNSPLTESENALLNQIQAMLDNVKKTNSLDNTIYEQKQEILLDSIRKANKPLPDNATIEEITKRSELLRRLESQSMVIPNNPYQRDWLELQKQLEKEEQDSKDQELGFKAMQKVPGAIIELATALKETDPNKRMTDIDKVISGLQKTKMDKLSYVNAV